MCLFPPRNGGRVKPLPGKSADLDNGLGFVKRPPTDGVDGPLTASQCQTGGRRRSPVTGAIHERDYNNWVRSGQERFPVHGVDETGIVVVVKRLRRSQVIGFFAGLPPCLIGMEACATAHHWARELSGLGHEVRLMPRRSARRSSAGLIAIVMDDKDERIPDMACQVLKMITGQIEELQTRIAALETQVLAWHKSNPVSQRLATIPGIGQIIATAIAATVADAGVFRSGREFAAWLGLVPRQNSTRGKTRRDRTEKRTSASA